MADIKDSVIQGVTGIPSVIKATPPIAVVAAPMLFDYTVPDLIQYATLFYILWLAFGQMLKVIRSAVDWYRSDKIQKEIDDAST